MELSDLKPASVDFTVTGVDLTFRPFTIADDLAARDLCGGQEKMVIAFGKFDFEVISLLAWYQLDLESQKKVLAQVQGVYIDPVTGVEVDAKLTPIDKFRKLFVGIGDQLSLITNLIKTKGINIPDIGDAEELKKWADLLNVEQK